MDLSKPPMAVKCTSTATVFSTMPSSIFVEEMGEKGPQANTVRLVGKHHLV
jgi:hypothetical protein